METNEHPELSRTLDVLESIWNDGVIRANGLPGDAAVKARLQRLLAAMVADTAPADLRGTAYGFFNLVSGLALLVASVLAGLLWDRFGAATTFLAGAGLSLLAIVAVLACPAAARDAATGR